LGNGSTIYYWHGLDLLAQSDGTQTEYLAYDGLGSVRQITDGAGLVEMTQTFDPYGNLYSQSGINSTTYGFTGEAQDDNGLLFLRARYYSAGMGRFINTDPSRLEQNPYQYGLSNPVIHTDPSGLDVDRSRIGTDYIYSCKCGWIDWTHAGNGEGTERMLRNLEAAAKYGMQPNYWGFRQALGAFDNNIMFFNDLAVVDSSNPLLESPAGRLSLAISFFMDLNEQTETIQGNYGVSWSSYSEEDLASDMLGFYMGYLRYTNGLSPTQARQRIEQMCEVFDVPTSVKVFDHVYKGTQGFMHGWKVWYPRLIDLSPIASACPNCVSQVHTRRFPQVLTSFTFLRIPRGYKAQWWWFEWDALYSQDRYDWIDAKVEELQPEMYKIDLSCGN